MSTALFTYYINFGNFDTMDYVSQLFREYMTSGILASNIGEDGGI